MHSTSRHFALLMAATLFTVGIGTSQAKEITIDATNGITKLSTAVADVYALDDGPDIINIKVDTLPMDDTEIDLNQPITINGDADGNNVKCDILVDVATIIASPALGAEPRCYFEIASSGDVNISDLKIHPNLDNQIGSGEGANRVDGVRLLRHADTSTTPTHTLSRVWFSGSDASDAYVPLDNADDLYNVAGVKRWSPGGNSYGLIHASKDATFGDGLYNLVLDNCHAGLTMSNALNLPTEGGHVTVIGGLYGHCGANGIRVSGDTVTLTGSHTNRLRIVRAPNISGSDYHAIFDATGTFDKVEWVDIASINTGRNIQVNGGIPITMSNCRLMGSITGSGNPMVYMTHAKSTINLVDCTVVGSASNNNPVEIRPTSDANNTFTNTIFVSDNLGQIANNNADSVGIATFTNCALPTDGATSESLNLTEPIFMEPTVDPPNYEQTGTVSVSPQFMLTRADYDWSEAQGEGMTGNSRGNTNVYRPTNGAYAGASDDGSNLVGGAGDYPARIDASEWMLM